VRAKRGRVGDKGVYARLRRAMGGGTAIPRHETYRAPCPRVYVTCFEIVSRGHGAR